MVICLIYMSSFYFWSPPFSRKIRKTNMRYYPEYPSGSWHPILTNGCKAGNFDLPDNGFLLLTCSTGPMEWSSGNSYQAEALTNVLRYQICRSSHSEDRKLPITELKWDARTLTAKLPALQPLWLNFRPLPVSRIAWHTCIIPQNVCTCLCFINIYSKTVYTSLDWSKLSSHPEDRKLPITELKWDARTVTDIPDNTAHWFFAFFWLMEGSRNNHRICEPSQK
jgi:hypothetical protein